MHQVLSSIQTELFVYMTEDLKKNMSSFSDKQPTDIDRVKGVVRSSQSIDIDKTH